MTASRQFAIACGCVLAVGLVLVATSDRKKKPVPTSPDLPAQPVPPPAAPAEVAPTVTAEGCVTPTPNAASVCSFRNGPPLPEPVAAAAAAVSGSFAYVIGGSLNGNGTEGTTTVRYSAIDAQGGLGDWKTTTPYPLKVMQEGVVGHNGFVYVLGGVIPTIDLDRVRSAVYFAKTNADGSLGDWKKGPDLPEFVGAAGYVVLNNFLYVIGGYSVAGKDTTSTGNVYFAAIKPNGALGPWRTTTPLTGGRFFFTAAAGQSTIYAMGGTYQTGGHKGPFVDGTVECETSRVLIGHVQPDGTISSWSKGTPFSDNSLAAGSVVVDKTLFLVQGRGDRQAHGSDELMSAPIADDGSIGAWHVVGHLAEVSGSRAVAFGPKGIYGFGGTAVIGGKPLLLPNTDVIPLNGASLACPAP